MDRFSFEPARDGCWTCPRVVRRGHGAVLVSLTEAAAANGMAPTTLRGYCQQGRVVGAERIGNRWAVPAGKVAILPPVRPHGRPAKERT